MVVDFQGFYFFQAVSSNYKTSNEHRYKILGSHERKACDELTTFHDLSP